MYHKAGNLQDPEKLQDAPVRVLELPSLAEALELVHREQDLLKWLHAHIQFLQGTQAGLTFQNVSLRLL